MNTLWVILNADKSTVVDVFETDTPDSVAHWPKFLAHKAGNVFCRRVNSPISRRVNPGRGTHTWYVNYHYWVDGCWGEGDPAGMGWSSCLAIPEAIKMLELLE